MLCKVEEYLFSHFADKETEAQRVTQLRKE